MAIQSLTLKPLLSSISQNPLHIQNKNLTRKTQLSIRSSASPSTPWEEQIPPNVLRRKLDPSWRGGFSLGVDLGMSRTGLALSKGFSVRPLMVTPIRRNTVYCVFCMYCVCICEMGVCHLWLCYIGCWIERAEAWAQTSWYCSKSGLREKKKKRTLT